MITVTVTGAYGKADFTLEDMEGFHYDNLSYQARACLLQIFPFYSTIGKRQFEGALSPVVCGEGCFKKGLVSVLEEEFRHYTDVSAKFQALFELVNTPVEKSEPETKLDVISEIKTLVDARKEEEEEEEEESFEGLVFKEPEGSLLLKAHLSKEQIDYIESLNLFYTENTSKYTYFVWDSFHKNFVGYLFNCSGKSENISFNDIFVKEEV